MKLETQRKSYKYTVFGPLMVAALLVVVPLVRTLLGKPFTDLDVILSAFSIMFLFVAVVAVWFSFPKVKNTIVTVFTVCIAVSTFIVFIVLPTLDIHFSLQLYGEDCELFVTTEGCTFVDDVTFIHVFVVFVGIAILAHKLKRWLYAKIADIFRINRY